MEKQILSASSGSEKHETYSKMLSRHKTAMKHKFYFEALLIDYAVIEDRLWTFLWAAGAVENLESDKIKFGNNRNKAQLRELYFSFKPDEKSVRLFNVTCKRNIVLSMIDFARKIYDGGDDYLSALHKGMQFLDLDGLEQAIKKLEDWCGYRNEIIHGAMNKNIYSLYEKLEDNAALGLELARVIDNESQKLKRRKYIRKSVNMPPIK